MTKLETLEVRSIRIGDNHRSDESEDLSGLMQSIKELGLLEPIGVATEKNGYRVIYGFRRFYAINKLGLKKIPCVIHDDLDAGKERAINLAENIQRSNPSLAEVGRWAIKMRDENKINKNELAVLMGVKPSYIQDAIAAFQDIPEAYRDDVEIRAQTRTKSGEGEGDGKVSMRAANAIARVTKVLRMTKPEADKLWEAAKRDGQKFQAAQAMNYAVNVRNKRDVYDGVTRLRFMPSVGLYDQDEYARLREKYIDQPNQPYSSVKDVVRAIVEGRLSETVRVI